MNPVFALADCNNFYVSCERVFNPRLQGKPVIVMSNNDGCVVARSPEAKALNIGMGVPVFEIKDLLRRHGVETFSSNYTLYADMSGRVMEVLSGFTPEMEVYSIDEAFLDLAGFSHVTDYAREIQETVHQWTGIPVTVGLGSTKTLAKLANYLAKRSAKAKGVLDLVDSPFLETALARTPVEKVWTVGIRTAIKLKKRGIRTALQLRDANIHWINEMFGVVGVRTVRELQGVCCYELESNPPLKRSLVVSRMFGRPVTSKEELNQAIACYASRAGEKLRENDLAAHVVTVFVTTSRFIKDRYFNVCSKSFEVATCDTVELIRTAQTCIERLYRQGSEFKKCGIALSGLVPVKTMQLGLFDEAQRRCSNRLMRTVDAINKKPCGPIHWAAEGIERPWHVQFKRRSPRYTTCWDELCMV